MSRKRRAKSYQRFVLLPHWMLDCPAWKTLRPRALKLLLAVWTRHNGSNNGEISFSVREAAEIGVSSSAAAEDFAELVERGFLAVSRQAAFTLKTKEARTWRLTAEPSGLNQEKAATRDFMRWTPAASPEPQSAPTDRRRPQKFRSQSAPADAQSAPADREPENETKLPVTVRPTGPSTPDYVKSQSAPADTSISTMGGPTNKRPLPEPAADPVLGPSTARPEPQRAGGSAGDGQATLSSSASVTPEHTHQLSTDVGAVAVAGRAVEDRLRNTTQPINIDVARRSAADRKREKIETQNMATALLAAAGIRRPLFDLELPYVGAAIQRGADPAVVQEKLASEVRKNRRFDGPAWEPPHLAMLPWRQIIEGCVPAANRKRG